MIKLFIVCAVPLRHQKSHLSQPNKSFVITALHDSFVTVNGGLLLLITCFMIVSVCRNYCWYQHIARKCVICVEAWGTISSLCLQSDVPENSWDWKKCLRCKKERVPLAPYVVLVIYKCAHTHTNTFPKHL